MVPKDEERELWLISITKGGCEKEHTYLGERAAMDRLEDSTPRVSSSERRREKTVLCSVGHLGIQLMPSHLGDQWVSTVPGVCK